MKTKYPIDIDEYPLIWLCSYMASLESQLIYVLEKIMASRTNFHSLLKFMEG